MLWYTLILFFFHFPYVCSRLQVTVEPSHVLEVSKSRVLVNCITKPQDDVNIHWEGKMSEPIPLYEAGTKEDVYVLPNNTLVFTSLKRRNTGTYTCNAMAIAERLFKQVKVETAYLQRIEPIAPTMVLLDYPVEIVCQEPRGKPLPSVEWLVNNTALPSHPNIDQSGWTLRIFKAGFVDEGNYTCVAKNRAKTRTASSYLTVVEPGGVEVRPLKEAIKEGESTSFNCISTADPPLKVRWKKSYKKCVTPEGSTEEKCQTVKEDVEEDYHLTIVNGVFKIRNALPEHRGVYTCQTELSSQISSSSVQLNVVELLKIDEKVHKKEQKRDIRRHRDTEVKCGFRGDGKYTVTWTRISPQKTLSSNMLVVNNTLRITNLTLQDGGRFTCVADGEFNSATADVDLVVFESPYFTVKPNNASGSVGDPVWVHCDAGGTPMPRLQYIKGKNGQNRKRNLTSHTLPNNTLYVKHLTMEDTGSYFCWLTQKHGSTNQEFFITVTEDNSAKSSAPMGRTVGIAVGCAGLYILLVIGLMIYCRARRARLLKKGVIVAVDGAKDPLLANEIPLNTVEAIEKYKFSRENMKDLSELGMGKSGRIVKATAHGITAEGVNSLVAVKMFEGKPDGDSKVEFDLEFEMFAQLNHENVVRLLGVITEVPMAILIEYTQEGNLKEVLKQEPDLPMKTRADMCLSISRGMEHLISLRYIHRDLAARNCIVFPGHKVKVSFLSLCESATYKDDYYLLNSIPVPLRWLAPEAILLETYSEKSDVWSFGVCMWEVMHAGVQPYDGMSNDDVLREVVKDHRLPTESLPSDVRNIFAKCWHADPEARATFSELSAAFAELKLE